MPSKSKKQHNLMALVANNPKAAKRLGIPSSVGEEFMKADKGKKFGSGGMAKKLFGGKETYSEELKEAKSLKSGKISAKQFVKGEKSEGHKDEENPSLIAREIKKGSMSPKQYASVESKEKDMKKVKKMAVGGPALLPAQAAQQATDALARRPDMPSQSNAGGVMRGLDRAAAMSGRDLSGMGRPALTGLQQAAAMSGRDFTGLGKPAGMKKGGKVKCMSKGGSTASKRADGIATKGKTKGKIC